MIRLSIGERYIATRGLGATNGQGVPKGSFLTLFEIQEKYIAIFRYESTFVNIALGDNNENIEKCIISCRTPPISEIYDPLGPPPLLSFPFGLKKSPEDIKIFRKKFNNL